MNVKKIYWRCLIISLLIAVLYGFGRLYFHLTAGFTLSNITSDFTHQPDWEVRPLSQTENIVLDKALNQSYRYLGKGCQSYAFLSEDGNYVIKFFKYQRYRLQPWLEYFPPLPAIVQYRQEKQDKKWSKLNGFVKSWKVAFENLKEETGLIFVHLNKTDHLKKRLTIYDKLNFKHEVNLDQMEFCIQQRAEMLCDVLLEFKKQNDLKKAKLLIDDLLTLIISEYSRGLADNDHALMQNTGVVKGKPIHIDVGQFVITDEAKEPVFYQQEIFTKTYKFKIWLAEHYPELGEYLDQRLNSIIGPLYPVMRPIWWNKN